MRGVCADVNCSYWVAKQKKNMGSLIARQTIYKNSYELFTGGQPIFISYVLMHGEEYQKAAWLFCAKGLKGEKCCLVSYSMVCVRKTGRHVHHLSP